ncbi:MAG: hypothetical protein U0230_11905 [Polyangiales bacterium]
MTRDSIDMLMAVSARLTSLPRRIAFVGGATTGLLVTDPAAAPPRATLDLDLIVEVRDMSDYATSLGPELRRLGAREDDSEGAPLCRWTLEGVVIDIMPTDARVLGFANRWYEAALASASSVELPNGARVPVVDAPHFVATKIEAFRGRGGGDFLASKDIEDIVAILDGRLELLDEIRAAGAELRAFLAESFVEWLDTPDFVEALPGHLPGSVDNYARAEWLEERIRRSIEAARQTS